jgi:hypothetical protein
MPPEPPTGLMPARTISVSIARDPDTVYRYASNPENLIHWLGSFVLSAENRGGQWILHTSDGPMEWTFIEKNEFGILDHQVGLPSGKLLLNPMRVVANGRKGSTVMFTLFQTEGMDDAAYERDAGMVQRDLESLKAILEEA